MPSAPELIQQHFPQYFLESVSNAGGETIRLRPEGLVPVAEFLKAGPGLSFEVLMDIAGVDYPGETPRFEVVYHLYSISRQARLRLKVRVPEEDPAVDTLVVLWKGANWYEREVFDMFGIRFRNHPELRRILLYDEFEGHPLRKDYPIKKRQPRIGPLN